MRLIAKDLTTVYVRPHTTTDVKGDQVVSFGTARAVKMNLQPSSKPGELAEYGIKPGEGFVALTTDTTVNELDGVCVDVGPTDDPDYQVVVKPLKWPSYNKLILQARV